MTVCIAAICRGGKEIVVVTDRMFTSPPPLNVEFESDESKIEWFADGIAVLPSGSTAIVTEMLDLARAEFKGRRPTIPEAAECLRQAYELVRLRAAEQTFALPAVGNDFFQLRKLKGVTLAQYLQPQPAIYQAIVGQMSQFNLETELLIAGVDDSGARIAVVTHPGSLFWLDKLGYGAVGSGAIHALATLNLSGQDRSHDLYQTMYAVYRAKRAAQVAPGVGERSDLAVVDSKGKPRGWSKRVIAELEKAMGAARAVPPPDYEALKAADSSGS